MFLILKDHSTFLSPGTRLGNWDQEPSLLRRSAKTTKDVEVEPGLAASWPENMDQAVGKFAELASTFPPQGTSPAVGHTGQRVQANCRILYKAPERELEFRPQKSSVDQQVAVVRGWRPLAISTAPPPVGQQLDQSLKMDPRSQGLWCT